MARKRRTYSIEFKQEAVRLVLEEGLSCTRVGRDLGVCKSVIRSWMEKAKAGHLGKPAPALSRDELEAELKHLRRENALLKEQREILKKAAAFFAQETR